MVSSILNQPIHVHRNVFNHNVKKFQTCIHLNNCPAKNFHGTYYSTKTWGLVILMTFSDKLDHCERPGDHLIDGR